MADLDAEAAMALECPYRIHSKRVELQRAVRNLKAPPSCRGELKEQ
jgi:hypothetical protein